MTTLADHFRTRVETFLEQHAFKPSDLGRLAIGDPSFVLGLRRGRSPTLETADRVMAFMDAFEARKPRPPRRGTMT